MVPPYRLAPYDCYVSVGYVVQWERKKIFNVEYIQLCKDSLLKVYLKAAPWTFCTR